MWQTWSSGFWEGEETRVHKVVSSNSGAGH